MSTTQQPEAPRDARWYMIDKDGMATLCTDREDAEKEAKNANMAWPHTAPHRAVQLVDVASVAASAGSEPVATVFTMEALTPGGGVKYHATIHKALPAGTKLYTHPSPPEGMVGGWMPIETAPVAGLILLVVEDSAGERRVFPAEASHENGVWVWQVTLGWLGWTRLHSGWTPILWRRIPAPPTSSADSGKGE